MCGIQLAFSMCLLQCLHCTDEAHIERHLHVYSYIYIYIYQSSYFWYEIRYFEHIMTNHMHTAK